jgi:hypothetical protein
MTADVATNLMAVRRRIAAAGGDRHVEVLAVTKAFGPDEVAAAIAAGLNRIGENYAQELLAKREVIERLHPEVHFIGRLQTNKVRLVAHLVDVWESIDRVAVADEVAKRSPGAVVYVQVDTTGDPAKGGVPIAGAAELVEHCRSRGLDVRGLMTVGPTVGGPEAARDGFRRVRRLADELALSEVSMGMTDDLEVAVEEGSTQVRIGTALFGARHHP